MVRILAFATATERDLCCSTHAVVTGEVHTAPEFNRFTVEHKGMFFAYQNEYGDRITLGQAMRMVGFVRFALHTWEDEEEE